MSKTCQRNAFTLIEVLIVVIIMAILAATIIPQFTSSTEDATTSTMQFNLHTMRSQIEVYKMHHLGDLPGAGSATFVQAMTGKTDSAGAVDAAGDFGPYVQEIPPNPYNKLATVVEKTPVAAGDDATGWQFDTATGLIHPNHDDFTP